MINKALPIVEAFYPGYSLLYLFDNAISHLIYTKDILQTKDMNKVCRRKQPVLRNRWFDQGNDRIAQPMNFLNEKNQ